VTRRERTGSGWSEGDSRNLLRESASKESRLNFLNMKTPSLLRISLLALAGAASLAVTDLRADSRVNVSLGVGFRLPHGYAEVTVGNDHYYHHRGRFYRHDPRHGFVVVRAPRGAHVRGLPPRAIRVYVGRTVYYRYDDIYYQPAPDGYVVVDAPVKVVKPATVVDEDYQSIWLNNTEYLFKDGQFFRKTPDGLIWTEAPLGAMTKTLPADATSIWYEGTEYFETDNVYFRKTADGFKVVTAPWKR
jgi:hypothetical protein